MSVENYVVPVLDKLSTDADKKQLFLCADAGKAILKKCYRVWKDSHSDPDVRAECATQYALM